VTKRQAVGLTLTFLVLFFSIASWWLLKIAFAQAPSEEWVFRILLPSLSFVVLGSFIGLVCLLEDDWGAMLGTMLLVAAPFFIFFPTNSIYRLGLGAVAFFFLGRGVYRAQQEKKTKIKLVLADILLKELGPVITGIALLASLGFYSSPYAQSMAGAEIIIPRDMFNKIIDPLLNASQSLKMLSAAQSTPQARQLSARENAELKDAVYQQLNKYLNTTGNVYKKFLPFGLATTFFFAVRIWGAILLRLSAMLAWAWFGVMRLLRLVKIGSVSVEKEVIEI